MWNKRPFLPKKVTPVLFVIHLPMESLNVPQNTFLAAKGLTKKTPLAPPNMLIIDLKIADVFGKYHKNKFLVTFVC